MHYNCLIVDDEQPLAESTSEYFNLFDVKTDFVLNSKDCFKFLEEHTVDVILLDINLEKESGFELCKKLRKTLDAPILFISARSSDDDILIALNIGGDDYIKKPYSLSVLLAKVKAVLKRYIANEKNTEKFLKEMNLNFLGELPMLSGISSLSEQGDESISEDLEKIFKPIVENIIDSLKDIPLNE